MKVLKELILKNSEIGFKFPTELLILAFFLADVLIVDNFSQNRLCIFQTAVNKTQRFFSFIFSFR